MTDIVIGGTYRHYKGNLYRVTAIARHSETLEEMVIYEDLSNESKIWARPAYMWNEEVTVNGTAVPRFSLVEEKEKN